MTLAALAGRCPGATGWRGRVPVAKVASVTADGGWKGGKGQKTSRHTMSSAYNQMLNVYRHMHRMHAYHTEEFTRHYDRFEQGRSEERLRIEARLTWEAKQADRLQSMEEFEMQQRRHPKFGRKWIENRLLREAREADRLLMVQEFEAREVARGVDLEELYGREECLVGKNHACFMTAPLKITVARGGPIAKKHKRIRFKMSGHKRWACDRLGFLPN